MCCPSKRTNKAKTHLKHMLNLFYHWTKATRGIIDELMHIATQTTMTHTTYTGILSISTTGDTTHRLVAHPTAR